MGWTDQQRIFRLSRKDTHLATHHSLGLEFIALMDWRSAKDDNYWKLKKVRYSCLDISEVTYVMYNLNVSLREWCWLKHNMVAIDTSVVDSQNKYETIIMQQSNVCRQKSKPVIYYLTHFASFKILTNAPIKLRKLREYFCKPGSVHISHHTDWAVRCSGEFEF